MRKLIVVFTSTLLLGKIAIAQPPTTAVKVMPGMPPGMDTAKKASSSKGPKAFKDFITPGTVTDDGLFTVYKQDDKYFIEIPNKLLGRDILFVNRVSKSSSAVQKGFYGYAGDQINQGVIRFEKGPNNKMFLKNIFYTDVSMDTTKEMYKAVQNSNLQPIASAFDIKFSSKENDGSIIEFTDYISGDNEILHFASGAKIPWGVGSMQSDKSYVVSFKSYPTNVEVKAVKTYSKTPPPGGNPFASGNLGTATLEINSSLIILPEKPMRPRQYDERVGYFAVGYNSFDENPQGVKELILAKRWRLEPKDEDIEKYKRGELVEPKKPIVFYIDPATPEKWIPYLISGVNDWQKAFESAGFKNAIMGKRAPSKAEDSTWTLDDARNSAIIYKASAVENAYGPSIADPRSGEIIESHIGWFHNVQKLLRDWYLIQTAAVDPGARKLDFDDELMGQLIRFVSSHEVGHTIGLRHNFGSSSTVPVEMLRNKAWVEANGHTPSIMDYARFNYVAQPEDNISRVGLWPRIGDYDKWAIEWGYKYYPDAKSAAEEKGVLSSLTTERLKNKRLWFGQESNPDDPRSQSEDVGENNMKANAYGIKNLQYIVKNLVSWTKKKNESFEDLNEIYSGLVGQYGRYVNHVAKHIGGILETPKTSDEAGAVYEVNPKADQKEAMAFLDKQLFTTPKWLLEKDILTKTGTNPNTLILGRQENVLSRLLNGNTLAKMVVDGEMWNAKDMYTAFEMLDDLKKSVFTELVTKKSIDVYRRNLQKAYVERLIGLVNPPPPQTLTLAPGVFVTIGGNDGKKSDVMSIVKAHARSLRAELAAASALVPDRLSKAHASDLADRLAKALDPK
jgi:Met-zincin/Domain of unknown function (DUF5117)/Domain of unknown function (DUF5118)